MIRMRKRLLLFMAALALLSLVLVGWLSLTKSGLHFLQTGINRFSGGLVHIDRVEGRLFGTWSVNDFHIRLPAVDISIGSVQCSWSPGKLLLGELNISTLTARKIDIGILQVTKNEQVGGSFTLPAVLLPFGFIVERFRVEDLRVLDEQENELMVVDLFRGRVEIDERILAVNNFLMQGPGYGLTLHGILDAGRDWEFDLLGSMNFAGFGFRKLEGTFSIAGPLENPRIDLGIITPADIRISAEIKNLFEAFEWRAKLEGSDVDLAALIESCPEIDLATISADLSGNIHGYSGKVEAKGKYDVFDELELTSTLSADWWGIDFLSLQIKRRNSSVEAVKGTISWQDIFSWKGRLSVNNFDVSLLHDSLPEKVTGDFVTNGNVLENGVVASFQNFNIEGVLHEHTFFATGNIFLTEEGVFTDGLTFRSDELKGFVRVDRGDFSWSERTDWSGDVSVHDFDPSWVFPGLPGSISGRFVGEGSLDSSGVNVFFTLSDLSGNLRGNELSGGGNITFSDGRLLASALTVKSGKSELAIRGRGKDGGAFDLTFYSPDLGQILAESGGTLDIQASVTGGRFASVIDVMLKGTDLYYKKSSFSTLLGELHFEPQEGQLFNGSISAMNMHFPGIEVNNGRIDFSGTPVDHIIAVEMELDAQDTFVMKAKGSYGELWVGEIFGSFLELQDYGSLRQQKKTALSVGKSNIKLEDICLVDKKSKVCLAGEIDVIQDNRWSVESSLHSVSMSFINTLKLLPFPIYGNVSGRVLAAGNNRRVELAEIALKSSKIELTLEDFDPGLEGVSLVDTELKMELGNELLKGTFFTQANNGNTLEFNLDIDGAGTFSTTFKNLPIRGRLEIIDFDPALLAAYSDYTVIPAGKITAKFTFAGTAGSPEITGESRLTEGSVVLPFQGIALDDVSLSLTVAEGGANVQCKVASGPGTLVAQGFVRYGKNGLEGDLQVEGDRFQLVNLPEYKIQISPDIHFVFSDEKGVVDGTVMIPYGLISPEELSSSAKVSKDVIFVTEGEEVEEVTWPFFSMLSVDLGDDVRIDGYGLIGKLEGSIRVEKTPKTFLTGTGKLNLIDGTFSIYNRSLEIERGRVLFTGGPIDNPGVDVRAQKKVRGVAAKGEGYTVGVDISGLVQDLKFRLFSDPYMDDAEILSYLVIGSSIPESGDSSGGFWQSAAMTLGMEGSSTIFNGFGNILQLDDMHLEGSRDEEDVSLVLGKRVTRDLYIGYDINMFSQLGEFRVRYDLDRGFFAETRSSTESTGVDLLYIFER